MGMMGGQFQWLHFNFVQRQLLKAECNTTIFLGSLPLTPRSSHTDDDNAATSNAKGENVNFMREIVIYSTKWREAGFQVYNDSYRTRRSNNAMMRLIYMYVYGVRWWFYCTCACVRVWITVIGLHGRSANWAHETSHHVEPRNSRTMKTATIK